MVAKQILCHVIMEFDITACSTKMSVKTIRIDAWNYKSVITSIYAKEWLPVNSYNYYLDAYVCSCTRTQRLFLVQQKIEDGWWIAVCTILFYDYNEQNKSVVKNLSSLHRQQSSYVAINGNVSFVCTNMYKNYNTSVTMYLYIHCNKLINYTVCTHVSQSSRFR